MSRTQPWKAGLVLALLTLAGCSTPSPPASDASSFGAQSAVRNDEAGALADPACTASSGFAAPTCQDARNLLLCNRTDGNQEWCLSSGAVCSDSGAAACTDKCRGDEFGVQCGAVGVNAVDPPGCRKVFLTTVGIVLYCCPCS